MKSRYRIKEHGNAFVPQKKMLFWWKNLTPPLASIDAARRMIHQRPPHPPRPNA